MQRRNFLTGAAAAGVALATGSVNADLIIPGRRRGNPRPEEDNSADAQGYVLLETYFSQSVEKRQALLDAFDKKLIPERNELGFDKVGVFYVDVDLMKDDRSYNAQLYDSAVFVVQETTSIENFLSLQDRSAQRGPQFNLSDDLDYIDEEMVVVRSIACQPRLAVPYSNSERLLQLRTYNSPNYERNFAKAQMFESAEHDLFRRCGMLTVFMGTAVFGSWVPNVT
ncbi:MAG: twin-arginine translocation signal domain-containing protein, partial [Thermoguttaceae bacterium]|nr:twin-arginine translocation signal domain-containing protein [Thermoguttaceae bacterium]